MHTYIHTYIHKYIKRLIRVTISDYPDNLLYSNDPFSQTLNLTVEAWDLDTGAHNEVIDVLALSINFLQNLDRQTVIESGKNGIGFFNFSYYIQQWDNQHTSKCDTEIPASSVTNHQVTLSPADISFTPTDNSTIQQVHESSSSPWVWITVTILFMLLTILFFTIIIALTCINRKMAKKLRKNKKGNACENNGE